MEAEGLLAGRPLAAAEIDALLRDETRVRWNGPQMHLARMVGAGLVRVIPSAEMEHSRHNLELTDTARFNLCLDQ